MVKQLMSFGEHMIGTLYGEWLDTPKSDFNKAIRQREVTVADLQKWQDKNPDMYVPENTSDNILPSDKQIDEYVVVELGNGMRHDNAKVIGVYFSAGKVNYDIELLFPYDDEKIGSTYEVILTGIDSVFVHRKK